MGSVGRLTTVFSVRTTDPLITTCCRTAEKLENLLTAAAFAWPAKGTTRVRLTCTQTNESNGIGNQEGSLPGGRVLGGAWRPVGCDRVNLHTPASTQHVCQKCQGSTQTASA